MAERIYYRWRTAEKEAAADNPSRMDETAEQKHTTIPDKAKSNTLVQYEARIRELESEKEKLQIYLESALKENEALEHEHSQRENEALPKSQTQTHSPSRVGVDQPVSQLAVISCSDIG